MFTYILVLIVCLASVLTIIGIRKSITEYRNEVYAEYLETKTETFGSIVYGACELGYVDLLRKAEAISSDIEDELDMEKLRSCMDNNLPYPEFDAILRRHLQYNTFTNSNTTISQNRNNIFVIINGKIVATYIHGSDYTGTGKPIRLGSGVTPQELIDSYFYNPVLSNDAINKILRQYKGLIVWQERTPTDSDIPKYDTFGMDELYEVYRKYGVDGFESFDILLPVYITEYGNIFGDHDVPGETSFDDSNKIIIVQKLNLKDYIDFRFKDLLDTDDTIILSRFAPLTITIDIFIILQCLALLSYAFIFIIYFNHKIAVEEEERELQALLEEEKKES